MANTWILVADASRARIFTADKHLKELHEIETLTHPESRLHDQELTSDLPGRSFNSTGEMRHAMEQNTDPKKQQAIVFAQQLAEHLDQSRKQDQYETLIIIAAPAMLGQLRDACSNELRKRISHEIGKDLTQHDIADIKAHLPGHVTA